jgi:hypothetical protein
MAAAITPMPNGHLQTKKARKLACFKFKKLEHMARNCSNPPLGLCHECCKTGGYQLHWSMDCPRSQRGPSQSRLWVYRLKLHMIRRPGVLSTAPA